MVYETIQGNKENKERVTTERLRKSMVKVIEYLHEEFDGFEDGGIPVGHIARDIEALARWLEQPEEDPKQKKYYGWRNYETWLAYLWLTNDEQTYFHWQDRASLAFEQATIDSDELFTRRETASLLLAKQMKWELEPEEANYGSFEQDLYRSAYEQIQWYEIATTFIDEVTE